MAGIRLKDIHKTYQVDGRTFPVLNGVDLEIPEGKITVILGQSGCGKTTLLRLTGGLESADSGEVLWDGAHKTAFVFQEPRLMPWLNVWNNIIFGLKKNQVDQEKIQDIVSTVNLSGFEKAYPSQLSGGMQQRAAIAQTSEESSPPESRKPTFASATRRLWTPATSFLWMFLHTVSRSSSQT